MKPDIKSFITKEYLVILCTYLFIFNTLIIPSLHIAGICFPHDNSCTEHAESHSDHEHENTPQDSNDTSHNSDDCMICKLLITSTIAPQNIINISSYHITSQPVLPIKLSIACHVHSETLKARAPPACA